MKPQRRQGETKAALAAVPESKPFTIGRFLFTETGLEVSGRPTFEEYEAVGEFIRRSVKASGFWLADWLRYGDGRGDWETRLSQAQSLTGLSAKTLKNVRAVGGIAKERRRQGVEFSLHEAVSTLEPEEQSRWLEMAEVEGWGLRELRLELRASRRSAIIEGQAVLEGRYRVIYADPPWTYANSQPSGSSAQGKYPGMTLEEMCRLPIAAHAMPNAVLFMWVTAPFLYFASDGITPDPYRLITAWGFEPKTQRIWDKVEHNFGSYFSVRHELLILATRGVGTPDHPTPMQDSVATERRAPEHSEKPEMFRKDIERMYDGPYLELFGRERVEGWTVFGNDARLWAEQREAVGV